MTPATLDASAVRTIEAQLESALREVVDEIERVECFDSEQRAEVYTILQAMLSDCRAHRAVIERLPAEQAEEPTHV